jgi:hypothetical protein
MGIITPRKEQLNLYKNLIMRRKLLGKETRKDMLSNVYKDSRNEYTEDNLPNALGNIFEELLRSLPKKDLEIMTHRELESIFKNSLSRVKEKEDKIYIHNL